MPQYNIDSLFVANTAYQTHVFEGDGSVRVRSYNDNAATATHNIYHKDWPNGQSYYAVQPKWINKDLGDSADPSYAYIILCRAYQGGGLQDKRFFHGTIIGSRGYASSGNNSVAIQVFVSSAYNTDLYGGVNYGSAGMQIVSFTYNGLKYLGVRGSATYSSADWQIVGTWATEDEPAIVSDGSVSSVSALMTLNTNP